MTVKDRMALVNEKKIISIIKEYPEGITLPEIAYIMGVAFVSLTQDMKRLLEKGLIKKKNYKYFMS